METRGESFVTEGQELAEVRGADVRVHYEGVKALDGVDLVLRRDEILGVIGPNGAGKTTLVNVFTGFERPTTGHVFLSGLDITRRAPAARARMGLARTFQQIRIFPAITVLENVEAGGVAVGLSRADARRRAWSLLKRASLEDRAASEAGALSLGDEKRVGVLRAVATDPGFLFLDEPAAGLNEGETDELLSMIVAIRDELGCGVLVIEHDMRLIMNLCERIQVLDYGKTIAIGTPDEIQRNEQVISAYLGPPRAKSDAED
jgi:ABC-type branched-subunit amino acid transport system ATPase component